MKKLLAGLGVLLALALLVSCGAAGAATAGTALWSAEAATSESEALDQGIGSAAAAKAAPSPAENQPGQAGVSNIPLPSERMVIKSATLSVRVRNVDAAYARAVQLAETSGGYVQSSTQYREGEDRADLTIRIPPPGFLPLIASLEALGTQESKSISGEDVTQEYYDLSAELSNQLAVRDRLLQLLKQATKVTDAIAVEQELERVGANVNRIEGRMKYLQTMTGLSTINVSLFSDARPAAESFLNWSLIGHGFFRAAQVLVQVLFFILQALVVVIPVAALGGGAAWGIVLLVRWVRSRRNGAPRGSAPRGGGRRGSA